MKNKIKNRKKRKCGKEHPETPGLFCVKDAGHTGFCVSDEDQTFMWES